MTLRQKSLAYWSGIFALMTVDGDIGWDDLLIGLVGILVYLKLIFKRKL